MAALRQAGLLPALRTPSPPPLRCTSPARSDGARPSISHIYTLPLPPPFLVFKALLIRTNGIKHRKQAIIQFLNPSLILKPTPIQQSHNPSLPRSYNTREVYQYTI